MPDFTPFSRLAKQKMSITVDDPIYRLVQDLADASGESASSIINYYLGEHSAEMAKLSKKYRAEKSNKKLPL